MTECATFCYCEAVSIDEDSPVLKCQACDNKFHLECLKSGVPSSMNGDVFFDLTCTRCSENGKEEIKRMKMQWTQVVYLALYNLQVMGQTGKRGYYRWKEHICAYIDRHWNALFGSHRKKTTLWHGTVAGTLSSGCPHHFTSGANELGETGWWRLTTMKPPYVKKVSTPKATKKRGVILDTTVKVEGLRSRRGKTSIESAMELKAKRETLLEAKDMRRPKSATQGISPIHSDINMDVKPCLPAALGSSNLSTSLTQPVVPYIKQEPDLHQESMDSLDTTSSFNLSGNQSFVSSSGSTSHRSYSLSESLKEMDEDSQFSYTSSTRTDSWFTEQDLKPNASLPSMLMSDDQNDESDSDFEIDPGTITPPHDSPLPRETSPSLQDILSSVSSSTEDARHMNFPNSVIKSEINTETYPAESVMSSSHQQIDTPMEIMCPSEIKKEPEEDRSVVDSESESESNDESDSNDTKSVSQTQANRETVKRKIKLENASDDDKKENLPPEPKVYLMSLYEERQLLKKMNIATEFGPLPPELHRLRRKLIVRQLQRERGFSVFDADVEMNRLAHKFWGGSWENEEMREPKITPTTSISSGDIRVLDRFQGTVHPSRAMKQQQPSFLNRLIGTDDDHLKCICSPYTSRMLKPFIRRDYDSRPLKMRLLEEIKAYPHRNKKNWKPASPPPIDYCYVRPQHIPSLNNLCREFFWPGIDLSECLQYPDFSCVVLFRKFVIAFAFMVPDVKFNEAYISFIFTHPEWRRAGIAKFMLYHLIQTCMGKDVTLHVSATNPAMLMYQKFGFKPEEFILDFYDKYYPEDSKECKHAFFLRLRR